MRKRIYEIVNAAKKGDVFSRVYDILLIICILISMVILTSKTENAALILLDKITVAVFVLDYLCRWLTADYKIKKGRRSFLIYPFSLWAVIDLISLLPVFFLLNKGFKLLKILKLLKLFRVFQIFSEYRFFKQAAIILSVLKKERDNLIVVGCFFIGYVLITAIVMFNIEPQLFQSFFDAVYWAVMALTGFGYNDIHAVTVIGRILTMMSALVGIALIALPAAILTSGFMDARKKD